ncbi:hypothetical protein REPUB_Repub01dG0041200 [Reevesia pubescens]
MLQAYTTELRSEEYVISTTPIWVHVYDLSLGLRNQEIAMHIGWKHGNLLAVDTTLDIGGWARFLRLRC